MGKALVLVTACLAASVAMAQFTATHPGPINSDGPAGSPYNGTFTFNYPGPAFVPDMVTFTGTATSVQPYTYLSELRWRITNPVGQYVDSGQIASGTTWSGPYNVGPVSWSVAGLSGGTVGNWTFAAWESYDDGGPGNVDATWTNVSFTFSAQTPWTCTNYFDEASFLANLASPYYLEDFPGWTYGNPLNGTQLTWDAPGNAGYGWRAYAAQGLWSNVSALSVNVAYDPLVITMTGNPVNMVGGIFTATDINGNWIPGDVTIRLASGATWTLTQPGPTTFFGFYCSDPIVSVTFNCVSGGGVNRWIQLDHFYVGIPEPASLLLLSLAGLMLRRR